jgi:dipeptidyl aminopeptidase/acylaminoacyl peptidase
VHGDSDRIASPQRSAALAQRLRRRGHPVDYVTVPGGKHAMLSHHREFTRPAARFAAETLRAAVTA